MQNRPQVWPGPRRKATRTAITGEARVCCFMDSVCLRHRERAISQQRARCYSMNLPTMFPWPQPLKPGAQEGLARGLPHRHVQGSQSSSEDCGLGTGSWEPLPLFSPRPAPAPRLPVEPARPAGHSALRPRPGAVYGAALVFLAGLGRAQKPHHAGTATWLPPIIA